MDLGSIKVKSLSELLASLVDYTSMHTDAVTDFTEGSVIRSIYEAIAMVLEQLYQLSTENVTWAIDHAILDAFDFTPREAENSYGTVTVDLFAPTADDVTLGRGTTFYSMQEGKNTLYFQTMQPYLIQAGTMSFKVDVMCTQGGDIGNIPADYIDSMTTTQLTVLSVTNEEAFLTGREAEKAEELKKRFREFVATRGRATKRAVKYGTESVIGVDGCYIDESTGKYIIYAHDANGNLPASLKDQIFKTIDSDYRPVGVGWSIQPMKRVKVSLDINIAVTNRDLITDKFVSSLEKFVTDYLNHFKADDDLVANEIIAKILGYSSLIKDVQFIGGATYTTQPEEIIRAGSVEVMVSDKPNFNGKNEIPVDGSETNPVEPTPEPKPDDKDKGKKLFGFIYYNYSYNYSKEPNAVMPVSVTYYDEVHTIITTLPYNVAIVTATANVKLTGNNTYTLYNDQDKQLSSLYYDKTGSVYTTYDEKGNVDSKNSYDNYGRVTKID